MMHPLKFLSAASLLLLLSAASTLSADLPGYTSTPTKPTLTMPPPQKKEPVHPRHGLPPKQALPPMIKPFGMPGVIGLQNGRWEGTDFLGYLSNNIGIDVEILKTKDVTTTISSTTLESLVRGIFAKEFIVPQAEVVEGPPLPFLHILVLIVPVETGRFAIFGTTRLFEQIQVIRKDFIPAGYWQGITWENQDVALASTQQLDDKIKEIVEKLATAFAKRYRQYNFNRDEMPPGTPAIPPPPPNLEGQ